MNIFRGAAMDLAQRLVNVGVQEHISKCIGEAAYLSPKKRNVGMPPSILPKSEVAWIASQLEKYARNYSTPQEIQEATGEACLRIFGEGGRELVSQNSISSQPALEPDPEIENLKRESLAGKLCMTVDVLNIFSGIDLEIIESDIYIDENRFISGASREDGFQEKKAAADDEITNILISTAKLCQNYFEADNNKSRAKEAFALPCCLISASGIPIEGFLVHSEGRVNFFSGQDYAGLAFGISNPLEIHSRSITAISCIMDASLSEEYGHGWDFVRTVHSQGVFGLMFIYETGESRRFLLTKKDLLADPFHAIFTNALVFLDLLDQDTSFRPSRNYESKIEIRTINGSL